jgi:trans-aconitate methyltransferase
MKDSQIRNHAMEMIDDDEAIEIENSLWWIVGRKKIIRHFLGEAKISYKTDSMIMDIGCGSGGNLDLLSEFKEVVGIEPSKTLLKRAKSRKIAKNVYSLHPWKLSFIKKIKLFTMFDVLEHIKDDRKFLTNLRSSSSMDHLLFLSVPASPFLFSDHDKLLNHYRRYTKRSLTKCLDGAGYKILSINYFMTILFPLIFLIRVLEKIASKLGYKKKGIALGKTPKILSKVLIFILHLETKLYKKISFPFGLWLFALAIPKKHKGSC